MSIQFALVVDDSKSARFALKKMLTQQGLKVDFAESAGAALNYLKENTPDVIFMDHLMPGMDGFEATKSIKQDANVRHIPIIMCSSQEGTVFAEQAMAIGATAILPKPAPVATLMATLNSLKTSDQEEAGSQKQSSNTSNHSSNPATLKNIEKLVKKVFISKEDELIDKFKQDLLAQIQENIKDEIRSEKNDLQKRIKNELSNFLTEKISTTTHSMTQTAIQETLNEKLYPRVEYLENQSKNNTHEIIKITEDQKQLSPDIEQKIKQIVSLMISSQIKDNIVPLIQQISLEMAEQKINFQMEHIEKLIEESAPSNNQSDHIINRTLGFVALAASLVALLVVISK